MTVLEPCPRCQRKRLLFPYGQHRWCIDCLTDHKTKGRTPS